jgi:hypothetical protein
MDSFLVLRPVRRFVGRLMGVVRREGMGERREMDRGRMGMTLFVVL